MDWNFTNREVYLPATVDGIQSREFKAHYLKVLAVYFAGLTISFPIQVFFLQDYSLSDNINWTDFFQQLPILNWVCMGSYTVSAVALMRKSSRLWAHLTSSLLLTGINNGFVAFTGWDYSAFQAFAGLGLFALPILPTAIIPVYRRLIWTERKIDFDAAAPRYKKRWRVELLSEGQAAPATGITINISDSGALIHLLNHTTNKELFDVRLTEAHQGIILDCKARRVREDVLSAGGDKPLPVMGIEFMNLTDDQKHHLQDNLNKTKHSA